MSYRSFDLADFTPYLLNQAAETQSLAFSSSYRDRYGMLRNEWRVLFHLGRYGPMTASQISERARTHKTKVSRAVRALEDKRFLQRKVDEDDRRVEWLCLRSAGKEAFEYLVRASADYETELARRLGHDEVRMLKTLLGKLG